MKRSEWFDCHPSAVVSRAPANRSGASPNSTAPVSILYLASIASDATDRYERALNDRCDYPTLLRLGGLMARATSELTTAITDAVACGDSSINLVSTIDMGTV